MGRRIVAYNDLMGVRLPVHIMIIRLARSIQIYISSITAALISYVWCAIILCSACEPFNRKTYWAKNSCTSVEELVCLVISCKIVLDWNFNLEIILTEHENRWFQTGTNDKWHKLVRMIELHVHRQMHADSNALCEKPLSVQSHSVRQQF